MADAARCRLRVTGTVQGVGFRPFVYRRAVALGLVGFVRNDSDGVLIEAEGDPAGIDALARALRDDAPPLARVDRVVTEVMAPRADATTFTIDRSEDLGAPAVAVSVDTAPCAACLAEVLDPRDRRHGYPFTNCTDCGPRYSIVRSVPYDRAATTMAGFAMCAECLREFDDPADRRFHAQPNACPDCGPHVTWRRPDGTATAERACAVAAAIAALLDGRVVAVKGVGGYHLAVDATLVPAVAELRRRKARDDKPFAVMVADLDAARRLAFVDATAATALSSPRRPIVLVPRRRGTDVADRVAPGLAELGLILPYSPLHHVLLAGTGRPLVMTSGNVSDEPIAHEDGDAIARLGPLADGLLTHDRPIHVRCDDSVVRAAGSHVQVLRRSRGYAPEPIALPFDPAPVSVLAVGAELKSTVAVTTGRHVVASQHIGDLEHLATYRSFRQAVDHLPRLSGVMPDVVAHDLHPEYLSTKFALELDLPTVGIQHHHAHVASCMVDHGRTEPVVALCFDGLGHGTDGTLWGGEVLVADFAGFRRAAHLLAVVMPGGVAAIREPWRMAAAWLAATSGAEAAVAHLAADHERAAPVVDLAERGTGPVTTAVGRLFDAVAALLGGRAAVTFEAQAAIELEAAARSVPRSSAPRYERTVITARGGDGAVVIDPRPLIAALVADRARGAAPAVLAAGFHEALGDAAARAAAVVAGDAGLDTVVLTGGVFQNVRLTGVVVAALRAAGLRVLVHRRVPANDGGISIGQAAIAAWPR